MRQVILIKARKIETIIFIIVVILLFFLLPLFRSRRKKAGTISTVFPISDIGAVMETKAPPSMLRERCVG